MSVIKFVSKIFQILWGGRGNKPKSLTLIYKRILELFLCSVKAVLLKVSTNLADQISFIELFTETLSIMMHKYYSKVAARLYLLKISDVKIHHTQT